jgi:chitodextrinase
MKKLILFIFAIMNLNIAFTQGERTYWDGAAKQTTAPIFENKQQLSTFKVFQLDVNNLKMALSGAPARNIENTMSNIVSFPNFDGTLEQFSVFENPNLEPELAAKYPQIKSYIGKGIDDPTATIYFSISPLGLQTMKLSADKSAVFIEPYTKDLSSYVVYRKEDKLPTLNTFECTIFDKANATINGSALRPNADDATLRTYRLALSCTGEYTTYFGGTKALALAAMNNTMTRVNGVFEKDFGVRMVIIANNDLVIYTNASTDPYSVASTGSGGAWNLELQNTLTSVITNSGYDIGHLFGASGGGGNAGCIGCVCVNPSTSVPKGKGSGFTSPADGIPSGDNFDIDYVAHEMGHQFGANHTFTHSNESSGVQNEPGSGNTIMGYAGITGATDVQAHSDAFFHAVSVQQVTNYIKTTTCQTNSSTGNAVPTADAGADYTIPKGTPFMLNGIATDANGDALTYCWEQMNSGSSTTTYPSVTATVGPAFKSFLPSTNPKRYFPQLSTILSGATSWKWEAVPNVARTMNFRFTVRDNRIGGSANNSDDMVVTVNATAGPFSVSAPNTAVSWTSGTSQTVTWAVAGTTANGINAANVDILLSTDGGLTYPITLLSATPNDGTQAIVVPNNIGTQCRIMVKGSNHIFFDVSNTNFTIVAGTADTQAPTAPTNLTASGTTTTTTNLSWTAATDNVGVTAYDIYKGTTLIATVATTTYAVTGLTASTAYSFSVKAKDAAGNVSAGSNTVNITTLTPDTQAPSTPTNLAAAGTTATTTNLSWTASTDNVGVTAYDVYQGATLKASVTTTSYAVTGLTASTAYTFSVKAKDAAGNVSASSNVVSVTTLAAPIAYCASQGASVADEYISKVQIGTINNTSTGGTGYSNFTSISTNVTKGNTYTITITPTWTGTTYSEGYGVWVDYNADGDFADAGEQVWTKAASTTTPVSGTFVIPSTASTASTRMRVSLKYNAIPTSCEAISYGEVEDYTLNIQAAVADVQAPSTPTNLTASGTTATTTNLSWTASTDNVGVTGYDVYQGATLKASVTTTSYAVTGLTASTAYTFSVKAKDAAGNISASSNTVNITTLTNAITYCTSKGNSVADEKIGRVQLGTINNPSTGGTGYTDFTSISSNVTRNTAYTITITPSWTSTAYSEGYGVWIDYNRDGDFVDAGEQVWTKAISTTTPVSGTFTIPTTATLGATRMRVSMKYNGIPTSCETFSYGQVEDYTVNIVSTVRGNIQSKTDLISLYPNPLHGNNLNITNVEDNTEYRIINILGAEIVLGKIENGQITLDNIPSGVYFVIIKTEGEDISKRFVKQ